MNAESKRKAEQALLTQMVALYCKGKHKSKPLCPDCAALLAYAKQRTARCPHMESKIFCSLCQTPCYKPAEKAQIRAVMRYAGPRMLLTHPILVWKHAFYAGKKTRGAAKAQDKKRFFRR